MNKYICEIQRNFWEKDRKRRTPYHPVVKSFVIPKLNYIQKKMEIQGDMKILDVGCGNGFFTYYLSTISNSVGIDFSHFMLLMNPCNQLVQGTAVSLPFKDCSFEVVFCSNLLHHIEEPKNAIVEMRRVSSKYVVLSEPNRNNPLMFLFSAMVMEERGALKFSLRHIKKLAESCGLEIIDSCSMGSIVPNKTPSSLLWLFERIPKNPFYR